MLKHAIQQAQHWEDRYRLLIQAGKQLAKPDDHELAQWTEIQGCEAGLWVKISLKTDRTLQFQGYSDARIINGLLKLLIDELNDKPVELIQSFKITDFFTELGIAQRLSSTRLNGLRQIEALLRH